MMEIIHENTPLPYGSNHIDFSFYENATGFLDSFSGEKFSVEKNVLPNTLGLDSSLSYLLKATNEEVHQNNLHTEDCTYSLDDIIDFETDPAIINSLDAIFDVNVASPGSSSSYEVLDTPVASPLSLTNDTYFLDLISCVSPGDMLQHTPDMMIPPDNSQDLKAASPLSVDSGFSSDDDCNSSTPLVPQLLDSENASATKMNITEPPQYILSDHILQFIKDIDNEEKAAKEVENAAKVENEVSFLTVNASDINIDVAAMNGLIPSENTAFPEVKREIKIEKVQAKGFAAAKEESKVGKIRAHPAKKKVRTPEQKLRKKAQNRKAASRYREKKKDELGDIFEGAAELEKQNTSLKEKVSDLEKEIKYLKNLMMDVLKARAAKSNTA